MLLLCGSLLAVAAIAAPLPRGTYADLEPPATDADRHRSGLPSGAYSKGYTAATDADATPGATDVDPLDAAHTALKAQVRRAGGRYLPFRFAATDGVKGVVAAGAGYDLNVVLMEIPFDELVTDSSGRATAWGRQWTRVFEDHVRALESGALAEDAMGELLWWHMKQEQEGVKVGENSLTRALLFSPHIVFAMVERLADPYMLSLLENRAETFQHPLFWGQVRPEGRAQLLLLYFLLRRRERRSRRPRAYVRGLQSGRLVPKHQLPTAAPYPRPPTAIPQTANPRRRSICWRGRTRGRKCSSCRPQCSRGTIWPPRRCPSFARPAMLSCL